MQRLFSISFILTVFLGGGLLLGQYLCRDFTGYVDVVLPLYGSDPGGYSVEDGCKFFLRSVSFWQLLLVFVVGSVAAVSGFFLLKARQSKWAHGAFVGLVVWAFLVGLYWQKIDWRSRNRAAVERETAQGMANRIRQLEAERQRLLQRTPPIMSPTTVYPQTPPAVDPFNSLPVFSCVPSQGLDGSLPAWLHFTPDNRDAELIELPNPQTEDPEFLCRLKVFRKAEIKAGPCAGGHLLLVESRCDDICKGAGCDDPIFQRFLETESQLILLTKYSKPNSYSMEELAKRRNRTLFRDLNLGIPGLERPPQLVFSKPDQVVTFMEERHQPLEPKHLRKIFRHEQFGDIYTSRERDHFELEYFAFQGEMETSCGDNAGFFACNAFYVASPDGTVIAYSYTPAFDAETHGEYIWYGSLEQVSVVPAKVLASKDLEPVSGSLLQLKDKNHPLLRNFYQRYRADGERILKEGNFRDYQLATYDEFIATKPFLFFRDPFNRLIRLAHPRFRSPSYVEPLIYLYPEIPTMVEVKFGSELQVTASLPAYQSGWSLLAWPNGELFVPGERRPHRHLFWEGFSFPLGNFPGGEVVEQGKVFNFLQEQLPQLGLQGQEIADFISYWQPRLSQSPFVRIWFLPQALIELVAPLQIAPQPRNIIRVMLGYEPLAKWQPSQPQIFSPPLLRQGFTVVEWGGYNP